MKISSSIKDYKVNICSNKDIFNSLQSIADAFWVMDQKVYDLYKDNLFHFLSAEKVFLIDAQEENKNIDTALKICEKMTELSAKRNATLISSGGGIIQDITGFAANILYRGIHWKFIPTTLLAACDSCIGGKTSLNYKSFKNLLGTFYPPDEIFIYPEFFNTLSEKDYLSGMGEVVKFNIMAGKNGLAVIEKDMDLLIARDSNTINNYINTSLSFKKKFIEQDEFDRGERIKLNFAHTFGHAFETLSKYEIPHGTAVAMGMIVANHISYSRGWLSKEQTEKMEGILKRIIKVDFDVLDRDNNTLMAAIRKDKKQIDNTITAVLMRGDMKLEIVHNVTEPEILEAVDYLGKLL